MITRVVHESRPAHQMLGERNEDGAAGVEEYHNAFECIPADVPYRPERRTPAEVALAAKARKHLALYRKNEDLISIDAYQKGASASLDQAIALHEPLRAFLRQSVDENAGRGQTFDQLKRLFA